MYQIGALLVNDNTKRLQENLYTIRNEMKEESILINYLISLENIDRFQIHKIADIMHYYKIDQLILHETALNFVHEDQRSQLLNMLDRFHIPYHFHRSEKLIHKVKEAFILYDHHKNDMMMYCQKQNVKCIFQFKMDEFKTRSDQRYLLDTLHENQIDYLYIEHVDRYQEFFNQLFLENVLQHHFEIIAPLENVNITDQIIKELGVMDETITVLDRAVLITERVTAENLNWMNQNLDPYFNDHDFDLVEYMEFEHKGLCQSDCDKLYHMIDQFEVDQVLFQNDREFSDFIRILNYRYPTFPTIGIEFQNEIHIKQIQEMVE